MLFDLSLAPLYTTRQDKIPQIALPIHRPANSPTRPLAYSSRHISHSLCHFRHCVSCSSRCVAHRFAQVASRIPDRVGDAPGSFAHGVGEAAENTCLVSCADRVESQILTFLLFGFRDVG